LPEVFERLVEQRHSVALDEVARLRAEHPGADADTLADLLIRRCMKDMALGSAAVAGAAASPVAGVAGLHGGVVDVPVRLGGLQPGDGRAVVY